MLVFLKMRVNTNFFLDQPETDQSYNLSVYRANVEKDVLRVWDNLLPLIVKRF